VVTDYIAAKLPNRVIPVVKGTDRQFSIRRRDPATGNPVNWNANVFVDIDINKSSPTRVAATVLNDLATVRIESTVCDQVKTGTAWRAVMSAGNPSLETALLVGTFERNDGR
jgi:hypothetical protein